MERGTIIHKESDYTMIDNGIFRDPELTLAERGFLCTILSFPADWNFSTKGMCEILQEGISAVKAVINRLVAHGYCKKRRIYNTETGRIEGYEYTFFEVKNGLGCAFTPQTDFPTVESPAVEVPAVENPHQLNTKGIKEKINKENNKDIYSRFDFLKALKGLGVSDQLASDWVRVRKNKRLTNTKTAFDNIAAEIAKTGRPAEDCVKMAVERSWGGFKAEWMPRQHEGVWQGTIDEYLKSKGYALND